MKKSSDWRNIEEEHTSDDTKRGGGSEFAQHSGEPKGERKRDNDLKGGSPPQICCEKRGHAMYYYEV